jgi:sugar lactone lactonase YvrE
MVQLVAIALFAASAAALRAQSVSFAGAETSGVQTTVPATGLVSPQFVAVDGAGDIFISEIKSNIVVKLTPAGVQTTVPATGLNGPFGVAADEAGDVFIADANNQRVVEVTPAGVQTTVPATGLQRPVGVAVDGTGDVFIADVDVPDVVEVTPAGVQTTVPATGLQIPSGVAVDGAGDVFIADTNNNRVVEVTPDGAQTTVGSGLSYPYGVAVDAAGDVFVADTGNNRVVEVLPVSAQKILGSKQIVIGSGLTEPESVAVDATGDVFVLNAIRASVTEISRPANFGAVNTCAGYLTSACLKTIPVNYTVTAGGTLGTPQVLTQGTANLDFTLANGSTCTGAVTEGSSCTVNVTFVPQFAGLRSGAVQIVDNSGNVLASTPVYGTGKGAQVAFDPGAQITIPASGLNTPYNLAVDSAGDVFIADTRNSRVLKVSPVGVQSVVPTTGLIEPIGLAVDGAGDLLITDGENNRVVEVSPAGVQTILPFGGLNFPSGVTVDTAGNIYVADDANNRIEKLTPAGAQTTISFQGTDEVYSVGVDQAGDVFGLDTSLDQVVELTPAGVQTKLPFSGLIVPYGMIVDGVGDVFVADGSVNDRVVEVPVGASSQITIPTSGLNYPQGVAVDAAGDVFVADSGNNRAVEVQRSMPPSLSFAATNVGQTSSDSPQSVTIESVGNQPLTAIAPGLSIGANFAQVAGSGTPEDCSGGFSLAAGASCNLSISFTPTTSGSIQSSAVLTDNALNANPATQSITLTGTGNDVASNLAFVPIPTQTYGVGQFWVSITSNSTGSATFSLVSGPATISGTLLTITGAGTVTLQVNQAASGDYTAGQAQTTFTVNPAPLTVTASSASRAYGAANPAFTYAITGFVNGDSSSVVSGTATEATTATSTSAPGSYPVSFSAQGLTASNYTFNYVPGTLTVTQASQTITFSALPNVTYGVSPIALTATASSSQPVTYTVTGPATVNGSTLTITGAGTVSVTANIAANTNYTAATAVTQSFTVAQAALTVTASSASRAYGAANPAFTYTIAGFVNGDSSSVVSGTATESTTATSTSAPGSYPVNFSAQGLTASNYTFNYVPGALTVTQASQTITFSALPNVTYGVSPIALTATDSSSLPVTYTVTGPATVNGLTLTITGAGTVSVTASVAANTNYTAATAVTQSFTANQVPLTVTANSVSRQYGAANPAFTYAVTGFVNGDSSSVVSGTATEITTATSTSVPGSYAISFSTESLTAANYIFNYVNGTLTINQTSQTITFAALPNVTYGAAPIALTATASSGLSVTYTVTGPAAVSGSTLSITGVGTVTVTASQAGNADYTAATAVTQSFTVNPATPTLTFTAIPNHTYGAVPFAVSATSNSTGAITYSVASGPATISGNIVTLTGDGTVTLQASQAVAGNYAAAMATTAFSVVGSPVITVNNGNNSLNFGVFPYGLTGTNQITFGVTINNNTSNTTTISAAFVNSATNYTVVSNGCSTPHSGYDSYCQITIGFTQPTTLAGLAQSYAGTLVLASSNPNFGFAGGGTLTVAAGSAKVYTNAPYGTTAATPYNFGAANDGSTGASLSFQIFNPSGWNNSGAPAPVSLSNYNNWNFTGSCNGYLADNSQCTATLQFKGSYPSGQTNSGIFTIGNSSGVQVWNSNGSAVFGTLYLTGHTN